MTGSENVEAMNGAGSFRGEIELEVTSLSTMMLLLWSSVLCDEGIFFLVLR